MEWAPHLATYLVWPHNVETWPGKFAAIPLVFAQMAAAIAHFEPVRILVNDAASMAAVRALIAQAPTPGGAPVRVDRIELAAVATNDSWVRDHGPIFVNRVADAGGDQPAQIAIDWRFNSWGGKIRDATTSTTWSCGGLGERYGFAVIEPGMVLEGGSIDVNGAGVLMTTEACLLNPNRNPALGRDADRRAPGGVYLGVSEIIWLGDVDRGRRYRWAYRRPRALRRAAL